MFWDQETGTTVPPTNKSFVLISSKQQGSKEWFLVRTDNLVIRKWLSDQKQSVNYPSSILDCFWIEENLYTTLILTFS